MKSRPSLACFDGTVTQLAGWARAAEDAGFESIWVTEFYDRSATVPLAAMASCTQRIGLGSGIAYAFGRTPLVLAAEARDLDTLSNGRLLLGLGTGTRRMMQDWHGLDGEHPAGRVEELVPLLRRLWRLHEEPIVHDGRFYRLHVSPTNPPQAPLRPELPIYLAGVNPRMIAAAGAVADGLVGHPLYTPKYVEDVVRPALAKGAERADRARPVGIAGYLICSIADDVDEARRRAAGQIALYAATKTYAEMLATQGFGDEVAAIRAAWFAKDHQSMVAAVPDHMVDAIALAGRPDEVRDQFSARWDGLYDHTLLYPPSFGGWADVEAVLDVFRTTDDRTETPQPQGAVR